MAIINDFLNNYIVYTAIKSWDFSAYIFHIYIYICVWVSQDAQWVKSLPAIQETQEMWVRSLDQEDPLEEGTATYSSILAWRIPWTEDPGRLQSVGSQRFEYVWSDLAAATAYMCACIHIYKCIWLALCMYICIVWVVCFIAWPRDSALDNTIDPAAR